METEAPDGYCASNGDCSPRKENPRMPADLSTSMPNGQMPQGPKSPYDATIKQEEETGEEAERGVMSEEMVQSGEEESGLEEPMTDSPNNLQDRVSGPDGAADTGSRLQPNGDRPFQCKQCGVSFTQKGNLLRHIKLHTGEKPFKCPFCSYACRRRDALTGHLRTHSVGKPHKCNYCGRSYKQRTSLEEHKERCHGYLQSVGMDATTSTGPYAGEVPKELRPMAEASVMAAFERPPVIERLQSNVGKRKSTIPQKFVGEKMMRLGYPDMSYEMGMKYEMMDHAINNAITYLGSDTIRPLAPHPGPPLSMAEVMPMVNPLFQHVFPLGHRMERPGSRGSLPPPMQLQPPPAHPPPDFPGPPTSNGPSPLAKHSKLPPNAGRGESPSNSGLDSADSARSSPQERSACQSNSQPPHLRSRSSPALVFPADRGTEALPASGGLVAAVEMIRGASERPASRDGVRVFGREGQEVRAFQCEHCRVLFLDHVMYTIHMGCHGYREPLECNICGHCSKDRYEFSSHIVRGEHTFQ